MKLRSKLLSILLTIVLSLGVVPFQSVAAIVDDLSENIASGIADADDTTTESGPVLKSESTNVAKIGDVEYPTLQAAIDACVAGENTITLLKDCGDNATLNASEKNITIDGNGKTYTGKISLTNGNGKTITVKNATLSPAGDFSIHALNSTAYWNIVVDNCVCISQTDCWNTSASYAVVYGTQCANTSITLKNSEISEFYYIAAFSQSGKGLTVENCNITGCVYLVSAGKCDAVAIKGVTYSGEGGMLMKGEGYAKTLKLEDTSIKITNGTYPYNPVYVVADTSLVTANITGVNQFVDATGTAYNDLTWTNLSTNKLNIEAQNGTKFGSLDAIAADAKSGDTIKLLKNIDATIELPYGITLDKNGFTADKVTVAVPKFAAMIGEQGFETLEEAFAEANKAPGDYIITLMDDNSETFTFAQNAGVNITVDGGASAKALPEDGRGAAINDDGFVFSGKIVLADGDGSLTFENMKIVAPSGQGSSTIAFTTEPNVPIINAPDLKFYNCILTFDGVMNFTSIVSAAAVSTVKHKAEFLNCTASNLTDLYTTNQNGPSSLVVENCVATNMTRLVRPMKCPSVTIKNVTYSGNICFEVTVSNPSTLALENVTINTNNASLPMVLMNAPESGVTPVAYSITLKGENIFTKKNVEYTDNSWVLTENDERCPYVIKDLNTPPVAEVNGIQYATLEKALAAANAGDTITFLADITEDVTISKEIIIDGAGKTYTGKMNIGTAENITVQNVNFVMGCIDGNTSALSRKLTVKNCTFDGVDKSIGYAITVRHGASLVIENSSANNYGVGMLYVPQSVVTITVKNVTVNNVQAAFNISYSGDSSFENIKLNNVTYGLHVQNHGSRTFTLKGCEFNCKYPIYVQAKGAATVTFAFEGNNAFVTETAYSSQYANLIMKKDAVLTAPELFNITTNVENAKVVYADGKYIVKGIKVAIGEETYATLAEAIEAANAGDTITFLADVTEDVTISKAITIDGANFKYTGTMKTTDSIALTVQNVNFVMGCIDGNTSASDRELIIKNCTFDGVDKSIGYAITVRHGASLVIENSSANDYGVGMLYVPQNVATITVKNVTVNNVQAAFNISYSGDALFEEVAFENVGYGIHFQIYGSRTYTVKNSDLSGATNPFWFWDIEEVDAKVTICFEGDNIVPKFQKKAYTTAGILKLAAGATLTAPEGVTITTDVNNADVVYENGIYTVVKRPVFEIEKTNTRFGTTFSLLFAFQQSNLEETPDQGYYALITRGGETFEISGDMWTTTTIGGVKYYVVEFAGIAAKEIADDISIVIYSSEKVAISAEKNFSIRNYAMEMLEKTDKPKYKTLLVDMLNFGAAAQAKFEYNTNDLANSGLSEAQKALASAELKLCENKRVKDDTYFVASNLRFDSKTNLLFGFKEITRDTYAVFTWEDHRGDLHSVKIDGDDYTDKNGMLVVELNELVFADARQIVTCTIYNSDGTEVTRVQDSIESNVARVSETNKALYEACMKFADSAYAYSH